MGWFDRDPFNEAMASQARDAYCPSDEELRLAKREEQKQPEKIRYVGMSVLGVLKSYLGGLICGLGDSSRRTPSKSSRPKQEKPSPNLVWGPEGADYGHEDK